jgi:hypothetical protein
MLGGLVEIESRLVDTIPENRPNAHLGHLFQMSHREGPVDPPPRPTRPVEHPSRRRAKSGLGVCTRFAGRGAKADRRMLWRDANRPRHNSSA